MVLAAARSELAICVILLFAIARAAQQTLIGATSTLAAVGRTFSESLQKALRSMETGLSGLDDRLISGVNEDKGDALRKALGQPAPDRLLIVAQALRHGLDQEEIVRITHIDNWFVEQIAELIDTENDLLIKGLPQEKRILHGLKAQGFSDHRLAKLTNKRKAEVTAARLALDVRPVFKRIDTCAAEFESHTPYMYSTYEGINGTSECESKPTDRKKIIILGGGPNRIGQGIEFDYCCVHAVIALREAGFEAIRLIVTRKRYPRTMIFPIGCISSPLPRKMS